MSDGAAGFLYPFLDRSGAPAGDEQALLDAVAGSTRAKARETIALRAQIDLAALERCADELRQRLEAGATVLAFGNGGSATDAQDLVVDLSERGWPAIALNADVATLTAIANDVGYEHVFARQLEALRRRGRRRAGDIHQRRFGERRAGAGGGKAARPDDRRAGRLRRRQPRRPGARRPSAEQSTQSTCRASRRRRRRSITC